MRQGRNPTGRYRTHGNVAPVGRSNSWRENNTFTVSSAMYQTLTAHSFGVLRRKRRRLPRSRSRWIGLEALESRCLLSATDLSVDLVTEPLAVSAEAARDFGDAPFPYATSLSDQGAFHNLGGNLWLGNEVDAETDGQGDWGASGDDFDNIGDEDGITFTSPLLPGQSAKLSAYASRSGRLQGWIDFNADGDWDDAGEQILRDNLVQSGMNSLSFLVPATAPHGVTYARFRLSDQMQIGPRGEAFNGEVEDYVVLVGNDTSEIPPPQARDDQFIVLENSQANQLDVLDNDRLPWIGGRITQIDATNIRGSVTIGPGGGSLIYTPYVRDVGVETLRYEVTNLVGESSIATVNILILDEVKPPTAEPDHFVFPNQGERQELHVLANDLSENGTIRIASVSKPSAGGAIAIQNEGKTLSYIPPIGFVGQEEFFYTIQDASGLTDEARVIVDLHGDQGQLRLRLETVSISGQPITNVRPGDTFLLNVLAQDLRETGKGIFAAYLDIEYSSELVVPDGPLVHSATYPHAVSGDLTQLGRIDEAGGTDGVRPLGRSEYLLLQVPFQALQSGSASFTSDPADESPVHDILVFGSETATDPAAVEFGATRLRVVQFTNDSRPNDVDTNQVVAPLDALLVINELNANGPRQLAMNLPWDAIPQHAVDVNRDGYVSPLDALQIINELNAAKLPQTSTDETVGALPSGVGLPIDERLDDSPPGEATEELGESDSKSSVEEATNQPVALDPFDVGSIESFFSSYDESHSNDSAEEGTAEDLGVILEHQDE